MKINNKNKTEEYSQILYTKHTHIHTHKRRKQMYRGTQIKLVHAAIFPVECLYFYSMNTVYTLLDFN